MNKSKKRILITGAAGFIGSYLVEKFAKIYNLRLLDRKDIKNSFGHEIVKANITDYKKVYTSCKGIHTVVHLAADPRMDANFKSLLKNNIIGTYNVFEAAKKAGCKRVIFASSINAVLGYLPALNIGWDRPVNPVNLYGVSKGFGESLGRYYANQGLSTICIRIGAVVDDPHLRGPKIENVFRNAWISKRDLTQLIRLCIDKDNIDFAIVNGLSQHKNPALDIKHAKKLLGYNPQDSSS